MLEQGASMNPASNRPYQRRKQYPLGLVLAPVSLFTLTFHVNNTLINHFTIFHLLIIIFKLRHEKHNF